MAHNYSYRGALAASEKASFRIEDVLGDGTFDRTKPFLPNTLARTDELTFLRDEERLLFNQLRGHAYLAIFGLVEEFILPFVLEHARPNLSRDDWETRALLQFAAEEAKHIHLFKEFRSAFERSFGLAPSVIGPPEALAEAVLAHDPLGIALAILHIEWMTQRHWVEAASDDESLDPRFKSLLRNHWMEEAQHAKLDTLIVESIASRLTTRDVRAGVADYEKIGKILDDGLLQQVDLDCAAFEHAIGRELRAAERTQLVEVQRAAYRFTFLESGATHSRFRATLEALAA